MHKCTYIHMFGMCVFVFMWVWVCVWVYMFECHMCAYVWHVCVCVLRAYTYVSVTLGVWVCIPMYISTAHACTYTLYDSTSLYSMQEFAECMRTMGWLRWVGCLKIQVSLQNTGLFFRALLQKRPIFLSILLIVATPYTIYFTCQHVFCISHCLVFCM